MNIGTLFYGQVVHPQPMDIHLFDGRLETEVKGMVPSMVVVGASGHRTYGGHMPVLPGDENVCIVDGMSIMRKISQKKLFYLGTHGELPEVSFHRADRVDIDYRDPHPAAARRRDRLAGAERLSPQPPGGAREDQGSPALTVEHPVERPLAITDAERRRGRLFLSLAAAFVGFAIVLQMSLNNNFLVGEIGVSGRQAGFLEAVRESCGIVAFGILALLAGLGEPLVATHRAAPGRGWA